jgi:hypothetical protein
MLVKQLDASTVTVRNQNRMVYANYILQKTRVTGGCQTSLELETGNTGDASILVKLKQGELETTTSEKTTLESVGACPVPPVAPTPQAGTSGSMVFSANFTGGGSQLTIPNSSSLAMGTSSFTIEWWQYCTNAVNGEFARPFSIGTYPNADIAVSYENGTFYLWVSNSPNPIGSTPSYNTWVHVAIVGTTTANIKAYVGGTLLGTVAGSYNLAETTTALAIGNETARSSIAGFSGRISNFRWVKGTALYTSNFTPPTQTLTAVSGTQLLLLAENEANLVKDSSTASRTVTNTGVTFSATSPF